MRKDCERLEVSVEHGEKLARRLAAGDPLGYGFVAHDAGERVGPAATEMEWLRGVGHSATGIVEEVASAVQEERWRGRDKDGAGNKDGVV